MDFYQINDLERLSGIKAHTIRIWEKRYGIISPYRSETNIRFYDDTQLKKLLNVASLSASGFKISKISALGDEALKAQILALQLKDDGMDIYTSYINDFIAAMLDFDEVSFNILCYKIFTKFGVQSSVLNVFYPFLRKTGILWSIDKAMPVQEHFATILIKKQLYAAINNLPNPANTEKKFLLFLPANEWHEIGLLFAEYLIRAHGFSVINLGQNVPFLDIEYVIKKTKPHYLITFLIGETNEGEIHKIQNLLSKSFKKIVCILSGAPSRLEPFANLPNLKVLNNPNEILNFF